MQKLFLVLPHLTVGATGIGLYGFVEVRWSGRQVMFGGHPVDPFFLEIGFLLIFIFGLSSIFFILVRFAVLALGRIKNTAIHELDKLQDCGEELVRMTGSSDARSRLRYLVLQQKYRNWCIEMPDRKSVGDDVLSAAKCAETLRWHGYIRGRYMLWNDRRNWRKEMARQERRDVGLGFFMRLSRKVWIYVLSILVAFAASMALISVVL